MASEKPEFVLAKLAIAYEEAFRVFFPDPAREMAELASAVMAKAHIRFWVSPGGDSITCTTCRKTSHNANDVANRYCGHCHRFHNEL
jgi:hypothetical protein